MNRYIKGKDGKMKGSIGAGKTNIPSTELGLYLAVDDRDVATEKGGLPTTWSVFQDAQHRQMHETLAEICTESAERNGRLPLIGLDLDNTIGDFTHGLRQHVARKRGIPLSIAEEMLPNPDEYRMWEGETTWFDSKQHFLDDFQEFEASGGYRRLPLYPGVSRTLKLLDSYGFGFIAFTARSSAFNDDTTAWLQKHRLPVSGLVNAGSDKRPIEGIDLYIEDNPSAVESLSSSGAKVVVFNQDYNDETTGKQDHTRRVKGWHSPRLVAAMGTLLLTQEVDR